MEFRSRRAVITGVVVVVAIGLEALVVILLSRPSAKPSTEAIRFTAKPLPTTSTVPPSGPDQLRRLALVDDVGSSVPSSPRPAVLGPVGPAIPPVTSTTVPATTLPATPGLPRRP